MEKPLALLIEDDRDVATLFSHVLDMAGYDSEMIYDGIEAMRRLAVLQPDVVLLDLQLPGISGLEILKKMRADDRMRTIPVIVVTAYAYYAKNLPIAPDLFLLKPVDIYDLTSLIQRLHDKKGDLREPPYDPVTHLFSQSYFSVRLIFAMERVRRMELERFNILFADLHPFQSVQEKLGEEVWNALLKKMADRFKGPFRPSDTLAWLADGCFLSLFEETDMDVAPVAVAKQVGKGLHDFLELHDLEDELCAQTGVIVCDHKYEGVQGILDDIHFVRNFVKSQPDAGHWVFSQNEIQQLRSAQRKEIQD